MLIIEGVLLSTYEKRAVNVRTAEIQSQCTILCNQLGDSSDLKGKKFRIYKDRTRPVDKYLQWPGDVDR